jgi:hypothetical protein
MLLKAVLALSLLALVAGCDDEKTSTPDTSKPDGPPADTIAGKETAPDTMTDTISDTVVSDTVGDTPGSARSLGQGCCAPGASNCTLGTCESGLTCFVISNGPYTDRGICSKACTDPVTDCACPAGTAGSTCPGTTPTCQQGHCMWLCLPDPQGCDSSQYCKCPTDLLCLGVNGTSMCLPKGG